MGKLVKIQIFLLFALILLLNGCLGSEPQGTGSVMEGGPRFRGVIGKQYYFFQRLDNYCILNQPAYGPDPSEPDDNPKDDGSSLGGGQQINDGSPSDGDQQENDGISPSRSVFGGNSVGAMDNDPQTIATYQFALDFISDTEVIKKSNLCVNESTVLSEEELEKISVLNEGATVLYDEQSFIPLAPNQLAATLENIANEPDYPFEPPDFIAPPVEESSMNPEDNNDPGNS